MRLLIGALVLAALIGCGSAKPDPSDPNLKSNAGKPSLSGPGASGPAKAGAAAGQSD